MRGSIGVDILKLSSPKESSLTRAAGKIPALLSSPQSYREQVDGYRNPPGRCAHKLQVIALPGGVAERNEKR